MSSTPTEAGDAALRLHFRPRARILQLLGDELIGSPRLAVFELVKNAYDADAEVVRVVLNDIERPDASIIVQDDGDGMSLETIRDIWLVPGHDHRARQRKASKRTRLNRLPLGEKGVGRFAAHKLGNRIELVTRAADQAECLVVINWAVLIRETELSDAMVQVLAREPVVFGGTNTGTRITISELRESKWTRGEVRRLQRQITSIASPFTDRSDQFETRLEAPGCEDWLAGVPDVDVLLERAPWRFRFRFDKGRFDWEYRFQGVPGIDVPSRKLTKTGEPLLLAPERDLDALGIDQEVRSSRGRTVVANETVTKGIGPISGHFYVFDRDKAMLNRIGESQLIRNYLDENGGIRVYRDNVRVYNYGEPGDDWLGLDLRRVNTPTRNISRNIVVGAVDLDLATSAGLVEKTNREGFVENAAFRRLQRIVTAALTPLQVERKRDKDRIRKLTESGGDAEALRIRRPLQQLRAVARDSSVAAQIEPLIDKAERDYDELRDAMLRAGLSGMGLAIVFHEVEHGVRALCDLIEKGGDHDVIRVRARELARVLGGFADLLRKGKRRPYSLNNLVRRVHDINRVRFRKHQVRLHCPVLQGEAPQVTSEFVFGLALGALNNLLDNAFYWLRVRWPEEDVGPPGRAIYMDVNVDLAEGPAVVVADTGPGFSDDPQDLTRPFFSRRPEGMGVGLYYANLVMELGDGCLAFPDAREADVPSEFDGAVLALIFPRGRQD